MFALCIGGVQSGGNLQSGNRKPVIGVNSNEEDLEAAIGVGLGELAEITVNNDADTGNYDVCYDIFCMFVQVQNK